tara:strand:- start:443 stop:652 length:210 start_codon:yes stop_codon:yes gene_type:complete
LRFNVAKALLNLWKIFVYSLHGLRDTVHHEMAFRIELAVAVILIPAALILPVADRPDFADQCRFPDINC